MGVGGIGGMNADVGFDRKLIAYISPWSPTENLGEFYLLRGAIISAFGHADQLAMKLCVQCAQVPQYQLRPKPPTRTGEKIEYLRQVLSVSGPLESVANLVMSCVNRLERLNEFRTLVAHAGYQVLSEGTVSFPETVKVKEERVLVSRHNSTTLARLRAQALAYARFSRACERLYYKLGERKLLPEVQFQSGWHSNLSPWKEPIEIPWPQPFQE